MLLRLKICTTVFILYEIVAIILLHCGRTCDAMFGTMFCDDHVFKYFIVCVAVPALAFLIYMWIAEIVHGARHRHSFMYKAKSAVHDVASNIRHHVADNISARDLEKLIIAALILGVKKYTANHPNHRRMFKDFLGKTAGDVDIEYDEYYVDDDDEDIDEDDDDDERDDNADSRRRAPGRNNATRATSARAASSATRRDGGNTKKRKK